MRIYQNYHCHKMYTNVRISDSVTKVSEYAERAVQLEHGIISTMEHGWQGRYIEGYELAKKHNLKFVFGTEAYWVKDRFEKDNTNAHICIFARTENARQCINDILSEANINGFYYQARLDLDLIFSLPADEVIITTACVAFWKYEDIEEIVVRMNNYFKYFYLEVQNHNTDLQKLLNKQIIYMANIYKIPLIFGADSHYISEDKAWERDEYLISKGIRYEDEEGWYLDYPDGDTAYQRFVDQGILLETQIEEAMNNTNIFLEVEEYDSPIFNKEIKMPIIPKYIELSQEERDQIYVNLIKQKWNQLKNTIPEELHPLYIKEITKEVKDVLTTKHADYFLADYEIIKKGIEKGGRITNSGRGSGVSYFTNKLLGFTKIDRIAAKVKMYPERFISPTRILESKSLADLDMNLGNPEVFAEAQKEIFGENCSYPMIAYGTYKAKSAFKMYAKAKNLDFDLANEVSQQIEEYELALKHAEEDEKDDLNVLDFVDEQYHDLVKASEEYKSIISDIKPHPCAYLIYQGNIRREIGLMLIKSKTGKKERLCTIMDGKWAEDYKFLKNDLLKVDVVNSIKLSYKRIGIPEHDEQELIKICDGNQKVWDIYANGLTMGINQIEKPATKHKAMRYKPQNQSELTALVAAIRPSFKSMYHIFEKRQPFEYGVKAFDSIIQTEEMPASFILYQEQIMAALNFAGVPMAECYEVIKNISKKREEKVKAYKDIFLKGFANKVIEIDQKSKEEADQISQQIWTIINNSAQYGFNASHAYSVALDSLYGAYLKSHYPLYFYEVYLNLLFEKGNSKDRIALVKQEAQNAFGIKFVPMRFRQNNTQFTLDENNNTIYSALSSIKSIGDKIAYNLYSLKDNQYNDFVDLLIDIKNIKACNESQTEKLIKLNYFEEWGSNKKLLEIFNYFQNFYDRKTIKKDQLDELNITEEIIKNYSEETNKTYKNLNAIGLIRELIKDIKNEKLSIKEQLEAEDEYLSGCSTTFPTLNYNVHYIKTLDTTYSPKVTSYSLVDGTEHKYKIPKKLFMIKHIDEYGHTTKVPSFDENDLIIIKNTETRYKSIKTDKGFEKTSETEEWINNYEVLSEGRIKKFNEYLSTLEPN